MNFDLIAVLVLVGLAVAFRGAQLLAGVQGQGPACGNCDNCGSGDD